MTTLRVVTCGPGVTVQDLGRPGHLLQGLSRGGAMDRLAIYEGAALLRQSPGHAVLEMAGFGGTFISDAPLRIALTGAPMRAAIDGAPLIWNASHLLPAGARLVISAAVEGVYGYLHLGGGVEGPSFLGSRAAHLAAGIGRVVTEGDLLPVGPDVLPSYFGQCIDPSDRSLKMPVRIVSGPQTPLFSSETQARFCAESLRRDTRGNRMGLRFLPDGEGFASSAGLSVLSETVVPGDIQVTGDGSPFILMAECQTTGGYPRLGTVLACDLPRVAQSRPGDAIRFAFVPIDEAHKIEARARSEWRGLARHVRPLVRRPEDIPDLLSYQLISGAITGDDPENGEPL